MPREQTHFHLPAMRFVPVKYNFSFTMALHRQT